MSNINDQENNVFTRTTQQAIKTPADTTRVRQAEDASSFRAAPVERHRRSDRYRSAGDASSFRPAVQPAEDNRFQDGGAAAPQWARRMPEDTDPALERYTARPRVPADDYDEPEEKRRALDLIMKQYRGEDFPYSTAVIPKTRVLRLRVQARTAKRRSMG